MHVKIKQSFTTDAIAANRARAQRGTEKSIKLNMNTYH